MTVKVGGRMRVFDRQAVLEVMAGVGVDLQIGCGKVLAPIGQTKVGEKTF